MVMKLVIPSEYITHSRTHLSTPLTHTHLTSFLESVFVHHKSTCKLYGKRGGSIYSNEARANQTVTGKKTDSENTGSVFYQPDRQQQARAERSDREEETAVFLLLPQT